MRGSRASRTVFSKVLLGLVKISFAGILWNPFRTKGIRQLNPTHFVLYNVSYNSLNTHFAFPPKLQPDYLKPQRISNSVGIPSQMTSLCNIRKTKRKYPPLSTAMFISVYCLLHVSAFVKKKLSTDN
jgi:hypothetical protein